MINFSSFLIPLCDWSDRFPLVMATVARNDLALSRVDDAVAPPVVFDAADGVDWPAVFTLLPATRLFTGVTEGWWQWYMSSMAVCSALFVPCNGYCV